MCLVKPAAPASAPRPQVTAADTQPPPATVSTRTRPPFLDAFSERPMVALASPEHFVDTEHEFSKGIGDLGPVIVGVHLA